LVQDPVVIPIEDCLDLHSYRPAEVAEVMEAYLEAAREKGLRLVRVIHGRGRGVQRQRIRRRLARCPFVLAFADAPPARGGWGATLIWLRPTGAPESG